MSKPIRVKIISKNGIHSFQLTELPQQFPNVEFIVDRQCDDYDWLVVYDDVPSNGDERLSLGGGELSLPARKHCADYL